MIVKEEFLNKLRHFFSLNLYEVKIWTALLSRGVATAGELSDIANVPRSRSYDVLESLEKKGFAVTKLGKPIKYIAVPPEEVLDRVKKKIQNDGLFKRLKVKKHYEKPCQFRRRKMREAMRRQRIAASRTRRRSS